MIEQNIRYSTDGIGNRQGQIGDNGKKGLVKIVGINGRFTHSCLAIFYLREVLEQKCPQFALQLQQFTINDNYFEVVLKLATDTPFAILFSTAIWNSSMVEKILPDLRRILPHTLFIIGGPQAEVIGKNMAGRVNCTIVKGEIEAMSEDFFTAFAKGELASFYQGSLLRMDAPDFAFPYRKDDFADILANRHIYYESSKGCPFRCSYCHSSVETGVYHKPLERVKEELRAILEHRPKIIRFIDRTFNDIPDRALAIWQFLLEEGQGTRFHFEMAPDRFTEEMFAFLEQLPPAIFQFEIGIQSTSEQTLNAIRRKADKKRLHSNIARLAAMDSIHLHLDLILGLPYDTEESFAQSFRDVFAMGGHYIQMGLLKILPGTEIAQKAIEYGYIQMAEPPYSLLASRWLPHEKLQQFYWFSELVEKFLNNRYFTSLWNYLRRKKEDIFLFCYDLLLYCQQEKFFEQAATHELMCTMLLSSFTGREDLPLIRSLLLFDWLRCNHRFLPRCLEAALVEPPQQTRDSLYQSLPMEFIPLFSRRERSRFFRKSFFLKIQQETAQELPGFAPVDGICIFLQKKEKSVHQYNEVFYLPENDKIKTTGNFRQNYIV